MEISEYINPLEYNLYFDINISELKLNGKTTIEIEITKAIDKIVFNSKELFIIKLQINNKDYKFIENKKDETITINDNFNQGKYQIYIEYIHCIGFDMDGLYYVKQDDSIIFSTQLEPIYARKVFPCFDSPNLKSKFRITIESDKNKTFLSNMPERNTKINGNNKIIEFKKTPLMSTYLVCIVVGDIKKGKEVIINDNILVNGYYFDKSINLLNNSIKTTAESVKYFENLFKINYKLPKVDIIGIPNFLSGAMENWGLITFRELGLMTDKVENISTLINSIEVIYHEISHQWFGNLVTLNSWKDIWLNEATATYFSWLGLKDNYKNYYPEQWYYLTTYRSALLIDGFSSTHPISTEIVNTNDVIQFFDEISYSKGSCLINYISEFMGRDNFMMGINQYLTKYSWKTAEPKDLYLMLDNYSTNKLNSISSLMKDFILIKGYPLLTIKKDNSKYIIKKQKFLFINKTVEKFLLDFPLKIRYFYNKKAIEETIEIKENILFDSEPIINTDNMILCMVNYENFNPNISLMKIEELMHHFDCVFYLALSGHKSLNSILDLVLEMFNKIDFVKEFNKTTCLFHLIIKNILQLNYIISSSGINNSFVKSFYKFIDDIKKEIYKILLFIISKKNKDMITTNWLVEIFNFYIDFEDIKIISLGKKIFDNFYESSKVNNFNDFPLHEVLFKLVVKYNDESDILEKINKIKNTTDDIFVRNSAIWSTTYSRDKKYLLTIMKNMFNTVKLQDIATFILYLSKNLLIQKETIEFIFKDVKNNSNVTYKNFAHIIERVTPNIYEKKLLTVLEDFYKKQNDPSIYAIELDKLNWHYFIIDILKNQL